MKKKISVDVLDHYLVPKTEVLNGKEKEKLLKKYDISEKCIPQMLADDPVSKAVGAKAGDVVRIQRTDPTGSYDYYRLVVG